MAVMFLLLGIAAYFFGITILLGSNTVFQENTAFLILLIGTVFIVAADISSRLSDGLRKIILSIDQLALAQKAEGQNIDWENEESK